MTSVCRPKLQIITIGRAVIVQTAASNATAGCPTGQFAAASSLRAGDTAWASHKRGLLAHHYADIRNLGAADVGRTT